MTSLPLPAVLEAQSRDAVFIVDTNALSAGAPAKAISVFLLTDRMDSNSASLYLSMVTIAEIEDGIAKSCRDDASQKAGRLS